jgi:hypothetical protein
MGFFGQEKNGIGLSPALGFLKASRKPKQMQSETIRVFLEKPS